MEIPGGEGSNAKPSGTEKASGVGGQTGKNPPWGVWIFSGTTHCTKNRNLASAQLHTHIDKYHIFANLWKVGL